jgi:hypothetical protein
MIANGRDDITLRSATTSPGDSAEILDQTWIGDIFERFSKDMGALLPKLGRMASAGGLAIQTANTPLDSTYSNLKLLI